MLADCYEIPVGEAFMVVSDKLEVSSRAQFGKSFANINANQRFQFVKVAEMQAVEERNNAKNLKASPVVTNVSVKTPPSFFLAKELTVVGYFTSEIGCTQALRYEPVPERYDSALPYKKGDKAWAT